MTAEHRGTFVISCNQTEIDGRRRPRLGDLAPGSVWRWSGMAERIDPTRDPALLGAVLGEAQVRRRVARQVRRMFSAVVETVDAIPSWNPDCGADGGFVVTDGRHQYRATILSRAGDGLLLFRDPVPPCDTDLRVISCTHAAERAVAAEPAQGLACFVSGTPIATLNGVRPVQQIRAGDLVKTRDNGLQPVIWAGSAPVPQGQGAGLPITIRAAGFAVSDAETPLTLSPDHRVMLRGRPARDLFGEDEVFVCARDLLDHAPVYEVPPRPELAYHHLLFERHQVIWAAGWPCESLHPLDARPGLLPDDQRLALVDAAPEAYRDPAVYGPYARRALTPAEAAILIGAAGRHPLHAA